MNIYMRTWMRCVTMMRRPSFTHAKNRLSNSNDVITIYFHPMSGRTGIPDLLLHAVNMLLDTTQQQPVLDQDQLLLLVVDIMYVQVKVSVSTDDYAVVVDQKMK